MIFNAADTNRHTFQLAAFLDDVTIKAWFDLRRNERQTVPSRPDEMKIELGIWFQPRPVVYMADNALPFRYNQNRAIAPVS